MVPSKRTIPQNFGTFFITFTCYDWLPLIEATNSYDLVYSWFDILKEQGHYINAFVIMPNHIHVLLTFTETDKSINTMIGNGKRFMAYEIIKRLKSSEQVHLLNKLSKKIESKRITEGKKHNVWQLSFDWKHCKTIKFMEQKVNYIHANPCAKKWHLCNRPEEYAHSSARQYLTNKKGKYEVVPYHFMQDTKLIKDEY